MRRYVLTGAPGAGKTSVLNELARLGHRTVAEAATDVVSERLAAGTAEPEREPGFIERIVGLQVERRLAATGDGDCFFDRSPICTLALARFLGISTPPRLRDELSRIVADGTYHPQVFYLEALPTIEQTPVRRIGYQDALAFGRLHVICYERFGFSLTRIPVLAPPERAAALLSYL